MIAAVSEPRLAACVSKVGRVDASDRMACRELLQLFIDDVVESLVTDGLVESAAALRTDVELVSELDALSRKLCTAFLRQGQPEGGTAPRACARIRGAA